MYLNIYSLVDIFFKIIMCNNMLCLIISIIIMTMAGKLFFII